MSSPDKRVEGAPPAAQLRIRLKYPDVQSFVEKFAPNVSRQGIFISSKSPKPVGTSLRFELLLSDGKSRLMKGEGVVTWIREYDGDHPSRPHGMGVKFSRLDGESRRLLDRIEAWKQDRGVRTDDSELPSSSSSSVEPVSASESLPVPESLPVSAGDSPLASGSLMPTESSADDDQATSVLLATEAEALAEPPASPPRPRAADAGPAPSLEARDVEDIDIEALLGSDGPALDAALVRARVLARALAEEGWGELAGLLSGVEPAPEIAIPAPVADLQTIPMAEPEPEPVSPPAAAPPEALAPPPEPAPPAAVATDDTVDADLFAALDAFTVATAAPPGASAEPAPLPPPPPAALVAADDRTIDHEINFDLDALELPAPPALPEPPPPSVLARPPQPRRGPPPPPVPVGARGAAVPPPLPPPPSVHVGDQTLVDGTPEVVEDSGSDDAKPGKKGFFSKLFKK